MIKAPSDLQDLRRRIYVKAKAEPSWRFWGSTGCVPGIVKALAGTGGVGGGSTIAWRYAMPTRYVDEGFLRKRCPCHRSHNP